MIYLFCSDNFKRQRVVYSNPMEKLLTVKQLCEILQVSRALVYKWVHYGFVPYIKIGGVVRFSQKQIEQWLKRREHKGRQKYKMEIDNIVSL